MNEARADRVNKGWSATLAVLLIGTGGWIDRARGAPITFNTALPVAKGEFIAREQVVVNQSGDDPSGLDRDRRSQAAVTVLGYGATGRLALFGVLPYFDNELDVVVGGRRVTRSASGFGDLTLFGRYTLVQRDWPGRNFRVAPFAGVKAPTGDDDERDALGPLPPSVQLGSGSWDPLVGVVATYQTLDYQVDTQLSYQANNKANSFEAGDVARLDGSMQYRLWPQTLTTGLPDFLYGVIEANLVHQGKDRINGSTDPNSGGTRLFLTPGIQYVSKRWIVEGTVQIPVLQDLNGTALENDYIARFSIRFNF
ncbi:transporter [Sedimenticola selenatireducens]|uniref:transporter n=1 Tax=Sedimenticola selenatireducens TaxID=191960 RepID=UPI0004BBBE55|nr:transporter [Sedimenticola selenatireducens]